MPTPISHETSHEAMTRSGIRLTPQRRHVYESLMATPDHPTALEVFMRAKKGMPSISLATVYNCLDALTEGGVIRQVNCERASSRYCPNLVPHGHFFCKECGAVFDIPLKPSLEASWEVPSGTLVSHAELNLRGTCGSCTQRFKTSKL
jgi:Fur family peroxide stress response transcriptional regulator